MVKGKKFRNPRKRVLYIAPKPGEPKPWIKVRRIDVEILKYRDVGVNKFLFPYNRYKIPSVCVVTPVYASVVSSVIWSSRNLEEILSVTDDVYRTTVVSLKLKTNSKYPLQCIFPTFYISNYKVTIFVGSNYPKGEVGALRNRKPDPEAIQLVTSILNENLGVVILSDDKSVALWRMGEDLYAFSPDGISKHHDLPILAKAKDVAPVLRFILQNASGGYALFSIKLLSKLQIKRSLTDLIHDAEKRVGECLKTSEPESTEVAEKPLEKTPSTKKEQKLNITDDIQQLPLAFNPDYNYISEFRGILRGSNFVKEPEKLFYTVIACALYLHHIPSYIWAAESMTEIIKLGKNLYDDNEDLSDEVEFPARLEMPVTFGRNKLNIDFEKVVYGEIASQRKEVLTLNQGIRKFFEIYDSGLIHGPQLVLIWQERGFFFYYDPKERDQLGRKWTRALSDDSKKGGSCVQWFKNPNDLADSYIATIAFKHRRDPYKIINLRIYENKLVEVSDDWEEWVGFGIDMWALVGKQNICHYIGTNTDDMDFGKEVSVSMGVEAQAFGTAVSVLVYSLMQPEEEWTPETIEHKFVFAMDFIKAILKDSTTRNQFKLTDLKYSNYVRDKRIVIVYDPSLVTGFLRMDPPPPSSESPKPTKKKGGAASAAANPNDVKLATGIEKFFHRNKMGVLQVKQISIPIWMHEGHFYMFYPYEKCSTKLITCRADPKGIIPVSGYAYALRFKHHWDLSNMLLNMLDFPDGEKYVIHNFIIEIFDVGERPLYNFEPYKEKSAILRPLNDFHEGDEEIFQIRADRQNLAVLMVSIGLTKLNDPAKWCSEDLNDIIRMGDRMFCLNLTNDPECKGVDYTIAWNEINLVIGMNRFGFTKNCIRGIFEYPEEIPDEMEEGEEEEEIPPETPAVASTATVNKDKSKDKEKEKEKDKDKEKGKEKGKEKDKEEAAKAKEIADAAKAILDSKKKKKKPLLLDTITDDLHGILKKWDEKTEAEAIIESGFFNLAIWKKDGLYYVFDSKASGPNGELTPRRLDMGKDKADNFAPIRSLKYYKTLSNEGSAYLVWFEDFKTFVDHIKSKMPYDYLQQDFILNEITLQNLTQPPGEIPSASKPGFKQISTGRSIIRGTICQNDLMFVHKDKQEAANCITALAFALVSSTSKWSITLLDIILKYGDRLYTKSLQSVDDSADDVGCLPKLGLKHIVKCFKIYKIKFEWETSKSVNDMLKLPQLKIILGRMGTIDQKKGYIVVCKGVTNAIWRAEGAIYVFEPKGSDPGGKLSDAGYASVVRLAKFDQLYDHLIYKFGALDGPNIFETFTISIKSTNPKAVEINTEELEKITLASKIPKCQEMFVEYKDKPDMKILKFILPVERVSENLACLAALVYSRLQYVELWDYNVFERIFFLAKYLYDRAVCDSVTCQMNYNLDDINPNFAVDNNIICHVNMQMPYQGLVTTSGKAQSMAVTLKNALSLFFKECQYCVIEVNGKFFALWHETEKFYLFEVFPPGNECFVISGNSLHDMYDVIMEHSSNVNLNWYQVWGIQVITIPAKSALCSPQEMYANRLTGPSDMPLSAYKEQCYYYDYVSRRIGKLPTLPRSDFTTLPDGLEILTTTDLRSLSTFEGTVDFFPILQTSCIIAAGMAHIRNPILWSKSVLEEILNAGVNLFVSSLAMKRINKFQITDLDRVFYLAGNRLEISPLVPCLECADKKNLMTVLTFVLRKYKTAYVITDNFCFTLIMEKNGVFLYYPTSAEPLCDEMTCGSSCLIKFVNLDTLLDKLLCNGKISKTEEILMGPIVVCMK